MSGDVHVRFCERLGVKLPGATHPLLNRTLQIVTADAEQVQDLAEGQAYLDALKVHFGIELDASYEALRPLQESDDEMG